MPPEEPWTIGRLLSWTTTFLKGKGIESAPLEARLLLAHALGCPPMHLYTHHDDVPPDDKRTAFRELVQRRIKGAPVAHLLGRKDFYLLDFEVNPDVLIPRSDTECVLVEAMPLLKPLEAPRVLDIGTGSGCIAIAVAVNHKGARLTATDLSDRALTVAARNAERHKVADRITFLQGDLFAPLLAGEPFDAILSNPPYIPTAVLATLDPDVRDHEPHGALDGGPDGFAVIDRLLAGAGAHLAPGGHLLFEIGYDQEEGARQRVERQPGFELLKLVHDSAKHPRVVVARWQP